MGRARNARAILGRPKAATHFLHKCCSISHYPHVGFHGVVYGVLDDAVNDVDGDADDGAAHHDDYNVGDDME